VLLPQTRLIHARTSSHATAPCTLQVVRVAGRSYLRLECIGKGGSSKVYRVLGEDLGTYALKRVRLARVDAASLAGYTNEIALLRRLAGSRYIIRLVGSEVCRESRCLHVVMEYGQIDLNALLAQVRRRLLLCCN
jgi:serine/threonine-protein kinase TTK/MPS1